MVTPGGGGGPVSYAQMSLKTPLSDIHASQLLPLRTSLVQVDPGTGASPRPNTHAERNFARETWPSDIYA